MSIVKTMPWWYRANAKKALESWIRPLIAPRPYTAHYEIGEGSYMNFSSREIVIDPTAWDFMNVAKHLPLTWNGKRVDTEAKLQWRFSRNFSVSAEAHVKDVATGIAISVINTIQWQQLQRRERELYAGQQDQLFAVFTRCQTIYHSHLSADLQLEK